MAEQKELKNNDLNKVFGGEFIEPTPSNPTDMGIASRALAEIGKPFIYGGVGPTGYDDSGLVSYAVSGMHTRIGTTLTFLSFPKIDNPEPGDICVNSTHCGIYIGSNQMVHAPSYGQLVCTSPVQYGMIFVRYKF